MNEGLLGAPTPAKASGLAFSLAAVIPVALSFVFLLVINALGLTKQEGYAQSDWYLYVGYLLSPLAFALVAVIYFLWGKTPVKPTLKRQNCHPKYYLIAVLLQVGLLSLSQLNTLFLVFLERFGYEASEILLPSTDGFGLVGVLFTVALMPAIFEELMFRGVLLEGMRSFGTAGAVLLCGGLFALYHQNPVQTVYQFCCGAAFALVAIRSGSILPTVLSHFLNNALIVLLYKFGVTAFPTPVLIVVICISVLCLLTTLGYLIFFDKKAEAVDKKESKAEIRRFSVFALVGIVICAAVWISVLLKGF